MLEHLSVHAGKRFVTVGYQFEPLHLPHLRSLSITDSASLALGFRFDIPNLCFLSVSCTSETLDVYNPAPHVIPTWPKLDHLELVGSKGPWLLPDILPPILARNPNITRLSIIEFKRVSILLSLARSELIPGDLVAPALERVDFRKCAVDEGLMKSAIAVVLARSSQVRVYCDRESWGPSDVTQGVIYERLTVG